MIRALFLLLLMMLGAACQPAAEQPLPTRVRLATATDIPPATVVGQTQFDPTPTSTHTPTSTNTPESTPTPAPSGTASATITPTITYTPSSTITATPSATPTNAPTIAPEERPLVALAFTAAAATVLPTDFIVPGFEGTNVALTASPAPFNPNAPGVLATAAPVTNCPNVPPGGFGSIFQANPALENDLGCPLSTTTQQIPAAQQRFQRGTMLWLNGEIFVLYDVDSALERYDDTFTEGVDPETSAEIPPAGLLTPIRGFLKVWSTQPDVRNGLGWATAPEQGTTATVLNFENGRMVWLAGSSEVFALLPDRWRAFAGTF